MTDKELIELAALAQLAARLQAGQAQLDAGGAGGGEPSSELLLNLERL